MSDQNPKKGKTGGKTVAKDEKTDTTGQHANPDITVENIVDNPGEVDKESEKKLLALPVATLTEAYTKLSVLGDTGDFGEKDGTIGAGGASFTPKEDLTIQKTDDDNVSFGTLFSPKSVAGRTEEGVLFTDHQSFLTWCNKMNLAPKTRAILGRKIGSISVAPIIFDNADFTEAIITGEGILARQRDIEDLLASVRSQTSSVSKILPAIQTVANMQPAMEEVAKMRQDRSDTNWHIRTILSVVAPFMYVPKDGVLNKMPENYVKALQHIQYDDLCVEFDSCHNDEERGEILVKWLKEYFQAQQTK